MESEIKIMDWKGLIWQPRWIFWLMVISSILLPLLINYYVWRVTRDYRYLEGEKVPPAPVAIVFGAGLWADGTPTPMLADRVQGAVELYQLQRVSRILMTGDNSSADYNEVEAMQRYAISQGVPGEVITLDYAGFSTYESCYRARKIFGVTQAVLITQRYHLPRAVYICRHLGVEVVGFGREDWGMYRSESMRYYVFREILAVVKALWQVHITRPQPTFLGPFEAMGGGE